MHTVTHYSINSAIGKYGNNLNIKQQKDNKLQNIKL